jgi:hypothetical protein
LDKLAEHVEEDEEEPESEGEGGEAEKGESVESQQLHGSFVDEGYGYRSDNEEQGEEGASPKVCFNAMPPSPIPFTDSVEREESLRKDEEWKGLFGEPKNGGHGSRPEEF